MQLPIPDQCARKQSDLAQNLEAVAGPDDESSIARFLHDAGHDRRKARDRAAPQIVAKSKSARQNDRVEAGERCLLVPDVFGAHARNSVQRRETILVAIRTRKLDDGEFHFTTS